MGILSTGFCRVWNLRSAEGEIVGRGTQQTSWSRGAVSKLPCESEHWERTRWQGTGEKRREGGEGQAERGGREWMSEWDHAGRVRGAAVWWTVVRGCVHSAERLPEGRQNGAHHYAVKGSAGLAISLSFSHSFFCTRVASLLFPHAPPAQHFSHSVEQGMGVYLSRAPVKPRHAVIKVKSCKWNYAQTVVCPSVSLKTKIFFHTGQFQSFT